MTQRFQTTRWSLILAAGESGNPESRQALSSLCESYWRPLYAFVRRQGNDPDSARDLTQAYFLTFLEKNYVADVQPDAGRFRTFLLASLKHFLSKERDRVRALKRGGGQTPVSIDVKDAESLYLAELTETATPESMFERQWAATVLDRAMARLQKEAAESGKRKLFSCLRGHLTGEWETARYRDIAGRLDMSEGAVKVAVHRSRRRFGQLLRAEIAETVADADDIDSEVRHLLEILKR